MADDLLVYGTCPVCRKQVRVLKNPAGNGVLMKHKGQRGRKDCDGSGHTLIGMPAPLLCAYGCGTPVGLDGIPCEACCEWAVGVRKAIAAADG